MTDGLGSPLIIFRLCQSASCFKIRLSFQEEKRGTPLELDQAEVGGGGGAGIPSDWLEVGKTEWKATNNGTASLFCYFHANHVFVKQILTHLSRNSLCFSSKVGCQSRRTNVRVISALLNDQELTWWSKIMGAKTFRSCLQLQDIQYVRLVWTQSHAFWLADGLLLIKSNRKIPGEVW